MEKERGEGGGKGGIKKKSVMRDQKVMRAVMRNKELFSSGLKNLETRK